MGKDLNMSVLLDFYGQMLTEKQRDVMELYYNEDLSLSEIAEHENISRQGVRDSIKRGEETVLQFEKNLHLLEKFTKLSQMVSKINEKAQSIYDESSTFNYSRLITNSAEDIINIIKSNSELI